MMISPQYTRNMARYNQWQNKSLYDAASTLSDVERRKDGGAFFRSVHETLCHLLWGDQIWMHRFSGSLPPKASGIAASSSMIEDWEKLPKTRAAIDHANLLDLDKIPGVLLDRVGNFRAYTVVVYGVLFTKIGNRTDNCSANKGCDKAVLNSSSTGFGFQKSLKHLNLYIKILVKL